MSKNLLHFHFYFIAVTLQVYFIQNSPTKLDQWIHIVMVAMDQKKGMVQNVCLFRI